jgi:choline dehydrogenase-like flavoprotein
MTAAQSRPARQAARDLCVTLADVRLPRRHASGSAGRRVVIIGGGTFGAILAAELYRRMDGALSQVTVLEDGPFLFSDHVQNLPTPGLHVPPPTIRHLDLYEREGRPRHEVWHLPWQSAVPFAGLAMCVGGRSLYWGAFSPEPCPSELTAPRPGMDWPPAVVEALRDCYFRRASHLLGLDRLWAHFLGPLGQTVTGTLFAAIAEGRLPGATPLAQIPGHPAVRDLQTQENGRLAVPLEAAAGCGRNATWDQALLKLQLPMAIEVSGPPAHPVFHRFSSVPPLARALADAHASTAPHTEPPLAVVPECHVERLIPGHDAVAAIRTSQGELPLDRADTVVLAGGTTESTRLALLCSGNRHIGMNLASHLRSNLVMRVPRGALGIGSRARLGGASLLVRCRTRTPVGSWTHFHHQVTAFGLSDDLDPGAQLALFHMSPRPDAEQLTDLHSQTANRVVFCISSVGQMEACNPHSCIRLAAQHDEYGLPRALVALEPSAQDLATWDAMDISADNLVLILTGGQDYEVLGPEGFATVGAGQPPRAVTGPATRREPLGTSHHELGTLWMGSDPRSSVTNPQCRLWDISNLYAAGSAVFPSLGSSNPVMPGTALTLRLADHLIKGGAGTAAQ